MINDIQRLALITISFGGQVLKLCGRTVNRNQRVISSSLSQECKYVLLIVRNGLNKMERWLPYFKGELTADFISKRYNIRRNKPTTHCQEYRQLHRLKNQINFVSKAVLLPKLTGLEIKEITEIQLESLFEKHLTWIKNYLSFLIAVHQQPLIIVYRYRKNGMALKSQLNQVKKFVHLISYDQLGEKIVNNTVIMLQPYLVREEDLAKFVIRKIASITNRIEYFQLCLEARLKHLEFQIIYPKLYEDIELNLTGSTYKRLKQTERKRTVYYDCQAEQIQIEQTASHPPNIPIKQGNTNIPMKQGSQQKQPQQIQQAGQQPLQSTKQVHSVETRVVVKNQNLLTFSSFNIFNNQAKPKLEQKPLQPVRKSKLKNSKLK